MVSCVVVVFLNAKIYVFVLYKMAFHFLIFNLKRHQRELFSPGQLQWLLPTTRFTRKKHAKKPRFVFILTDFGIGNLVIIIYIGHYFLPIDYVIFILTQHLVTGSRDYPSYFVLEYQPVSVASYSESCLNRIENKMASCINWSLNSVPI